MRDRLFACDFMRFRSWGQKEESREKRLSPTKLSLRAPTNTGHGTGAHWH